MKKFLMVLAAVLLINQSALSADVWVNDLRRQFTRNSSVIYEINLRTFGAQDTNKNGIIDFDEAEESGTFLNAISRLDELRQKGINTLHVMPITPVGKIKALGTAGSLYAASSLNSINPQLVSDKSALSAISQARKFVDEAHKRGISVIIDLPSCGSYDFYMQHPVKLQAEYNFDGFRVDHIDHIVDKVSENNGRPISYRAPRVVLGKLNRTMKNKIPYFGTLAEYMLWDDFLKEYHKDMSFDLLWGNDIVSQSEKTPEKIMEDNQHLANYNVNYKKGEKLSILKTYNNQDGEFRCIDQYPGQLSETGALFKWFKYKFLPGGKFAQRPMLYVDGDESFTKRGIEMVIGDEISMPRENHYDFYKKFNAIDCFVKENSIINNGEAQIIIQDDDGFAAWIISKVPEKTAYLIVTNSKYTTERVTMFDENNQSYSEIMHGNPVFDKTINLPTDYTIIKEYYIDNDKFVTAAFDTETSTLHFDKLDASEFRVYELKRA